MKLSLNHCFLTVHDQDVALAFYTEVLGLELRSDVPFDGMRWLTVGPASQPDLHIGLLMPGAPWSPPEEVRAALDITAKGLMPGVIFETPDVDALFLDPGAADVAKRLGRARDALLDGVLEALR